MGRRVQIVVVILLGALRVGEVLSRTPMAESSRDILEQSLLGSGPEEVPARTPMSESSTLLCPESGNDGQGGGRRCWKHFWATNFMLACVVCVLTARATGGELVVYVTRSTRVAADAPPEAGSVSDDVLFVVDVNAGLTYGNHPSSPLF